MQLCSLGSALRITPHRRGSPLPSCRGVMCSQARGARDFMAPEMLRAGDCGKPSLVGD